MMNSVTVNGLIWFYSYEDDEHTRIYNAEGKPVDYSHDRLSRAEVVDYIRLWRKFPRLLVQEQPMYILTLSRYPYGESNHITMAQNIVGFDLDKLKKIGADFLIASRRAYTHRERENCPGFRDYWQERCYHDEDEWLQSYPYGFARITIAKGE